jgi:methylated-DNA-[protein]-cysteine S-methyltransferase
MAEMRDIESALRQAGRRSYASESKLAARRLSECAADGGLADVAYMTIDSPVGPILMASTRRGLVRIAFATSLDLEGFAGELAASISPRVVESAAWFDSIRRELEEYFQGRRTRFDLPLDWSLTGGFGRRVLRATARIPYGAVSTYRDVAREAGNARAYRAAGNALGANPIPLVVPCHRVLHSGGGLGGYGGGLEVKEFLLRLEGALEPGEV